MNNVLLFVPPKVRKAVEAAAAQGNTSMRELYQAAIQRFVVKAQAARRSGTFSELAFLATYKHPKAARLQMWLDDATSQEVTRLAQRAAVTRRSFCYTAILDTYPLGD